MAIQSSSIDVKSGDIMSILLWVLGGALLGAAIVTIYYAVSERISLNNIGEFIRNALNTSSEDKAKEALAEAINIAIKNMNGNTISISCLDAITGKEKINIELTGTDIENDIQAGIKMTI